MQILNEHQLTNAIKEALEKQNSFKEPTKKYIEAHIEAFVQAGINGSITNREWSPRYAEMQKYYAEKYLSEVDDEIEFPLLPISIKRIINKNQKSFTEKNCRFVAMSSLVTYFTSLGLLPQSRISAIREAKPKRSKPVKKRFITREQVDLIIKTITNCPSTLSYSRVLLKAVIESAYELGIRISELCSIKISDIDFDKQEIFIPKAKGNKSFTKGFNNRLKNILLEYLNTRPRTECLNLFVLDNGKSLTRDTLIQRFRRITKKLGLDTSFHAFRRNYITRHLQDGKSLIDVSIAVNHFSPRMTEQYLVPDIQKSIQEQKQW